MNTISPLDRTRDKIADSVETKYKRQTDIMTINKQVNDVITYFKRLFNIDKTTGKKASDQAGHLNENIRNTQKQLDQINNIEPILVGTIITLVLVAFIYLLGSSLLGTFVHPMALLIVGLGIAITTNFSSSNK
jgi:hypothetical protein